MEIYMLKIINVKKKVFYLKHMVSDIGLSLLLIIIKKSQE